jgi:hypothetical protein
MLIKKMVLFLILGLSVLYANNNFLKGLTDIVDTAEKQKVEKKKVLNYAFKQRMRTQLIARDVLLIAMNFNTTYYQKEILKNTNAFHENFYKLISSKEEIEKAKKLYPDFSTKIDDLNRTWLKFNESIQKISKDSKDETSIQFIVENNIKLLDNIAYIFDSFIKSYQSSDKLEASMAHIKSMLYTQVGKPRMYMNQIIKDRLSIKQNIHLKESQKNIKGGIKNMDRLMIALKHGDKELELNGTEDRTILEKLFISQKIWEEAKVLIQKKKLTKEEWATLIKRNDSFIKAQTEVVKLTRASNDN